MLGLKRSSWWLLALALSTVSPGEALATTVVPVTIEEMSSRSDLVVLARVRRTQSQWASNLIVTDAELEIVQTLRGNPVQNTIVRVPGGTVGRIGQTVPGVVMPEEGRTYAFFLQRATDGTSFFYLTHLTAAVLTVRVEQGNPAVVLPAVEGMVVRGTTAPTATNTVMDRSGIAVPMFQRAVEARR